MKLYLKNIGKIENCEIEINGISIIAGVNNTGKSTVGRSLFAIFNGFHAIQNQIIEERISSIENILDRLAFRGRISDIHRMHNLAQSIIQENINDAELLKQNILDYFAEYEKTVDDLIEEDLLNKTILRIKEVLGIDDSTLLKTILSKRLNGEFNGQISNIFNDNGSEISLEIAHERITTFISDNKVFDVYNPSNISLHTEAIYIDDPFVLDESAGEGFYYRMFTMHDHRNVLRQKLVESLRSGNIVDEIIAENKLDSIYQKISQACDGDIVRNKIGIGYRKRNDDKTLYIRNLSTGMKTFAILKTLLINGIVEENGTIILDEPEIHLHPEWQLLFAELIVLLCKEFGLHILMNTHSPYFLRAIQVYSGVYSVADKCRYYLSEADSGKAIISDVTGDIERIYAKLSAPLQHLEDVRWHDD